MRPIDADSLKPDMIHEYNTFPAAPQYGTLQRVLGVSMEQIAKAPTIEPKRGEWIETSDGTMCGNCHKFPYDDGEYHIANWYSDFCPNCGADMREREGERCR